MMRALVEPCWAAMRLPSMFLMPLIGLPFLTRNWAPVTKKVSEKPTLSRRAGGSVMVSAIRSTALDERSGIRVGGALSFFSTLIALPSFFSIPRFIKFPPRRTTKPTPLFLGAHGPGGGGAGPGSGGEGARLGDLVQRALLLGERRRHPGHEQRQRHHESHQSSHSRPPCNGLVQWGRTLKRNSLS